MIRSFRFIGALAASRLHVACWVAVFFLVPAAGWAPSCQAARLKIAIVSFDTVNDLAKDEGWGRQVSEMLTTAAVNTGSFEVVERHLLEKIMSEQAMGDREQGFTSVAQSVGNMVGADYLLSGSVFKSPRGQLRVDARVVDVASGEIIVAKSFLATDDLSSLSAAARKLVKSIVESVYAGAPPSAAQTGGPSVQGLQARFTFFSPSGLSFAMKDGDELTASEAYSIALNLGNRMYVYVAQIDSMGNIFAIFPNQNFSSQKNPLAPGKGYRLPEQDFFTLDENTGKERLLAMATVRPSSEVESLFEKMLQDDGSGGEDLAQEFQAAWDKADKVDKDSVWFWHR